MLTPGKVKIDRSRDQALVLSRGLVMWRWGAGYVDYDRVALWGGAGRR